MNFESYSFTDLLQIVGSAGFGVLVTVFAARGKNKAETQLATAQTQYANIEVYSTMLGDLRTQINMQGDQIRNQAEQILNLQKKENEYVKIIKNNQAREREYINKIKLLEKALKEAEELLKEFQLQFQKPRTIKN